MPDISRFQIEGNRVEVKDSTARESIGNLPDLATTEKENIVAAVNEIHDAIAVATMTEITYDSSTNTISFTLGG